MVVHGKDRIIKATTPPIVIKLKSNRLFALAPLASFVVCMYCTFRLTGIILLFLLVTDTFMVVQTSRPIGFYALVMEWGLE